MKNGFRIFLGLFLVLFLVACTTELEEINIEGESIIFVDESFTFVTNIEVKEYKVDEKNAITITNNGVVTGLKQASVIITIVFIDGREKDFNLEVIPKVEIVISGKSEIAINETFEFDSNIEITYISSSNDVVNVLNDNIIKGIKAGEAVLTIHFVDDRQVEKTVKVLEDIVMEESKSIIVGSTFEIISNIEIKQISINNNVVSVFENNIIKGDEVGVAVLTITFIDGREKELTITVSDELIIIGKEEIYVGEEFILSANQEIKEFSFDNSYLSITEENIVRGLKAGNVDLTIIFIDNQEKVFNISILSQIEVTTNIKTEMVEGEKYNIEVNLPVLNYSTNSENLTVSANGHVFAKTAGEAIITIVLIDNREFSYSVVISKNANYEYYHTKVLSFDMDNNLIELLDVPVTSYDEDLIIEKLINGNIEVGTIEDLYLGIENIYTRINLETNMIEKILIEGEIGFSNIRVGIRNTIGDISDDYTLFHDIINFSTSSNTLFKTFDNELSIIIPSGKQVEVEAFQGKMEIYANSRLIASTTKRILFIPEDINSEMIITSIMRAQGNPSYAGNLEISLMDNRLLLINDVSLENYLTKVVPSEMPTSYNMEALKAQSIAARTYAYADILNRSTSVYGYSVDDSVKSQVYNNSGAQSRGNEAVYATRGRIMMSGDSLVQAFYYSTSSGLTGSASEIWFNGEVPYLVGQNLTTDDNGNTFPIDPTSEASMLTFFKTIKLHHPDESISFHRWTGRFTKAELLKTLNVNLSKMRDSAPNDFLTKSGENWVNQPIPNNVGEVYDMYVAKRGVSGVVMELIFETSTGTYKIINQYNIRFTVRPKDSGVTIYSATSSDSGFNNSKGKASILFSGFFAIEKVGNDYVFYGGGNGHGVGMSQNGANYLGKNGKTFQEILTTYYSNVSIVDKSYNYIPIDDYKDYLG